MSDRREPKITQVLVAGHRIGLRDLEGALERVCSRKILDEAELKKALVEAIRHNKNYISPSAESKYEGALLREYKRFLGESVSADEDEGLTVKVLGKGCPNCRRLTGEVMGALTELNLAADVEHVTDIKRITEYGAVGMPALVINKKIVSVGRVPSRRQIKKWLEEETKEKK